MYADEQSPDFVVKLSITASSRTVVRMDALMEHLHKAVAQLLAVSLFSFQSGEVQVVL
jgi:hypothetical protein